MPGSSISLWGECEEYLALNYAKLPFWVGKSVGMSLGKRDEMGITWKRREKSQNSWVQQICCVFSGFFCLRNIRCLMKAASQITMFPHPWQQYRGGMFTQNNSLVTSLMCWAQTHFPLPWACCTSSIPTCFFTKHTYCVSYRELPLSSFLEAAPVSISIYLTEAPGNSRGHFSLERSRNFQSVTFGD